MKGQKPPISENINTLEMGETFIDLALITRHHQ